MKRNRFLYCVVLLLLISIICVEKINSQTQIEWVKTYGGLPDQDDVPQKIITDKEGNIFVIGITNVGQFSNQRKACLIKYKPNGDSVFTRLFTSTDSLGTSAPDIVLDDSLNIYIAGRWSLKYNKLGQLIWAKKRPSSSSQVKFNSDGELIYSGTQFTTYTFFVVYKCNTNGDTLQKGTYGAPNLYGPQINGLVIDNENNIIITGKISKGGPPEYFNMITIKFSPNCEFLWAKTYNGSSSGDSPDEGSAILTDSLNNIYVTGVSQGPLGGSNFYTIKYNKFGEVVWERREIPPANGASDMKMDKDHNLIIVGKSSNFWYRVLKLTSDGDFIWTQSEGNPISTDPKVLLDSAGNIYIGCTLQNSGGYSKYQIIKYNSAGVKLWNAVYPGTGTGIHYFYDIVLDKFGNVIVTGNGTLHNSGDDFITVKFSQTTGVLVSSSETPKNFVLNQNYPNPFNPSTIINYQLTINSFVILNVYDVNGKLLKELVNEKQSAGNYSVDFDGSGLPSGTYVYRLQAGDFSETKKMVLLK